MAGRVRRRTTRDRRGLSSQERRTLLSGWPQPDDLGRAPWAWKDADDVWHADEAEMRRVWIQFRAELVAEVAELGLVPWAGREFDGAEGRISPYEGEDPRLTWRSTRVVPYGIGWNASWNGAEP